MLFDAEDDVEIAGVAAARAGFTADSNAVTNIDAGVEGALFFLATGGETTNAHTKLNDSVDRLPTGLHDLP